MSSISDLFHQKQLQQQQNHNRMPSSTRARSIKDISLSASSNSLHQDLPYVATTTNGNEDPQLTPTLPHNPVHFRNETTIVELKQNLKSLASKLRSLNEEQHYWRNMIAEGSYNRISHMVDSMQIKDMSAELQLQTRDAMKQLKQSISSASEHSVLEKGDPSCDDDDTEQQ